MIKGLADKLLVRITVFEDTFHNIWGLGCPKIFHEVKDSLMITCESQVESSKLMLISILGPEKKMRLVRLLLFTINKK